VKRRPPFPKPKFKIGDKAKVIGIPPLVFPGKDEIGTVELLRYMLGRVYTVRGFDEYGNVELHPRRRDWVWFEPEFLRHPNLTTTRRKGKRR